MKIAWHIEECLFFSMEVSEIWYLHSFFFINFSKVSRFTPAHFGTPGWIVTPYFLNVIDPKIMIFCFFYVFFTFLFCFEWLVISCEVKIK